MEKKNEKGLPEKWFEMSQDYAQRFSDFLVRVSGMKNPTSTHQSKEENTHDFESCEELKFESVLSWVKANMAKVEGSNGVILRRSKQKDDDFKYMIEIFFLKDKQVMTNTIYKVILCNSIEDDMNDNFKDVNGQDVFIIR